MFDFLEAIVWSMFDSLLPGARPGDLAELTAD